MTIIRYNPQTKINSLQHQIDKIFDNVVIANNNKALYNYTKVPRAELTDTETALILKLELPGMNVEDINIEATSKNISVSGERKSQVTEDSEGKTRTEFRYGEFSRVIPLTARIKNTEVRAEYKDGILHLTLPKLEAEQNKVVKVNLLAEAES